MGEGATPLLEGLAWVTSLFCVIYFSLNFVFYFNLLIFFLFYFFIKSQHQSVLKLVDKKREAFWAKKNETCWLVSGWVHKFSE